MNTQSGFFFLRGSFMQEKCQLSAVVAGTLEVGISSFCSSESILARDEMQWFLSFWRSVVILSTSFMISVTSCWSDIVMVGFVFRLLHRW